MDVAEISTTPSELWVSPTVSNVVFMCGVGLCLCGLILLIAASVMMSKAITKEKEARFFREMNMSDLPDNSPYIMPSVESGTMRLPAEVGRDATAEECFISGQEEYPGSPVMTPRGNPTQADMNLNKLGQPPEVYIPDPFVNDSRGYNENIDPPPPPPPSSAPPPCLNSPSGSLAYACNPIPSPEARSHYDTFDRSIDNVDICNSPIPANRTMVPPAQFVEQPHHAQQERYLSPAADEEARFFSNQQPYLNVGLGREASMSRNQRM